MSEEYLTWTFVSRKVTRMKFLITFVASIRREGVRREGGREWPRKVIMLRFSIKQAKDRGNRFPSREGDPLSSRQTFKRKFLCILKLCVQGLNVNKKRCHVKNILNRLLYPPFLCAQFSLSFLRLFSLFVSSHNILYGKYNILSSFFFYFCSNKTTHAISLFLFSYYISSCLLI